MMLEGSYQQLNPSNESEDDIEENNHEETPGESGVMIHVVPETGKLRWNHIEDLDSFFTRMYHYHQKHGFTCMMLQEVFELGQFIFVVTFAIFLFHCVDYSILFKDKVPATAGKTSLTDAILPSSEALASMGLITWISIFVAGIFWSLRAIKVLYHFIHFWDIKSFYNIALKINDNDLDNLTWHEIQRKVIEVQKDQEMCVHKRELTELDIYHRILRFKNYTVSMINKSLLPVQLKVPFVGDLIFMTQGFKYNLELILFWGPWSPFENSWHLKEDYKKLNKRQELAESLSRHILWIGVANLILCPLIFLWQILYSFCNYGELLKREPGALGTRMWSLYGKLYLRHFNELDHELNARLNRAYRPASKYMSLFTSPMLTIIAKNIAFISGSIFAVFLLLTFYDEDFFTVEHVVMIITLTGGIAAICRSLIPDENVVWAPETLLTAVLCHTHYRPDNWQNQAHTQVTRAQVAQIFQYRAVHLFEELISPLLTPYILCFHLRHRALDIVDFYRNFTIEVTGVGDVCSFAQMNVKKHGNPLWQVVDNNTALKEEKENELEQTDDITPLTNQYTQAEDGKTELSLIHFTLTNPEWKPPKHAENFVTALRERAKRDALSKMNGGFLETNNLYASINSLSTIGPEYDNMISNIFRNTAFNQMSMPSVSDNNCNQRTSKYSDASREQLFSESGGNASVSNITVSTKPVRKGVHRAEGPLHIGERSLLYSLQQVGPTTNYSSIAPLRASGHQDILHESSVPLEMTTLDMALSTLYMHNIHHSQIPRRGCERSTTQSLWQRSSVRELSTLPEVRQERFPLLSHQDSSIRTSRK